MEPKALNLIRTSMGPSAEAMLDEAIAFIQDTHEGPCERMMKYPNACGDCHMATTQDDYDEDYHGCWRRYFALCITEPTTKPTGHDPQAHEAWAKDGDE